MAVTPAGEVIGHVLCTRGHVGAGPALGVGPLTVRPDHQRRGVGSALMHAIIGAADALGEPLIALLGDPAYYSRFGFRASTEYQVTPPRPQWGPHFQVRALAGYQPALHGTFAYPEPSTGPSRAGAAISVTCATVKPVCPISHSIYCTEFPFLKDLLRPMVANLSQPENFT